MGIGGLEFGSGLTRFPVFCLFIFIYTACAFFSICQRLITIGVSLLSKTGLAEGLFQKPGEHGITRWLNLLFVY